MANISHPYGNVNWHCGGLKHQTLELQMLMAIPWKHAMNWGRLIKKWCRGIWYSASHLDWGLVNNTNINMSNPSRSHSNSMDLFHELQWRALCVVSCFHTLQSMECQWNRSQYRHIQPPICKWLKSKTCLKLILNFMHDKTHKFSNSCSDMRHWNKAQSVQTVKKLDAL